MGASENQRVSSTSFAQVGSGLARRSVRCYLTATVLYMVSWAPRVEAPDDASICSADVHRDAAGRSALRRVRRLPAPRRPDRAELAPRLPLQGTVSHYHVAYSFIPSAC